MINIIYEVKILRMYLYVLTFNALGSHHWFIELEYYNQVQWLSWSVVTAGAIAIRTRQGAPLLALA